MGLRGQARIDGVVNAAADMFLDMGYEALTIDMLIKRTGGSRRNIYDHFGGKPGLFVQAVGRLCDEVAVPIEELASPGDDFLTWLSAYGRALVQIVLSPRALDLHRLMIAEGRRFPALALAIYGAGHRRAEKILAAAVDQFGGQSSGIGCGVSSDIFARQFVTLLVSDTQLRVLAGIETAPLPPNRVTIIVDDAIRLMLPNQGFSAHSKSETV